jgi:hypothetical protein
MTRTKFLKGECQHCAGHLEFPVEMAGLSTECPHCHEQTELLLAAPPEEPTVPRRTIVWAIIGVVVLSFGLIAALVALKRAERWAARQKRQPELSASNAISTEQRPEIAKEAVVTTIEQNGFTVSAITLETTPGTSRVYAVGTLKNKDDRKRFGVKVELDLFDATDQNLGVATDYHAVLEPAAEWHFKALVLDTKATSAKIASIKEEQ